MESRYQKWVSLSYLGASVLLAYMLYTAGQKVSGIYDLEMKVAHLDVLLKGISGGSGCLLFLILVLNKASNQFMNEVMSEFSKVTWPTVDETRRSTGVVIVMVLVSGMILGFLDYCWSQLVKWIL